MPLDFTPFIADLRAQVAAAWPEVTAIWDAEHAERVAWLDLELPYAVILIPDMPRSPGRGMDASLFEPWVFIYYVAETQGKATELRGKLSELVDHLHPVDPLSAGQVLDIGKPSWGDELAPNQVFLSANRNQRAGVVPVRCLTGSQPE